MDPYNNGVQQRNDSAPWFIAWMVISVIELAFCNLLTGTLSLVMVLLGNEDYRQGRIVEAQSKKKIATIATVIGVIFTVVIYIVILIWGVSILAYATTI